MTKQFIIKDRYFLEAKKQGYRARSAFKLLEVDAKFKLIKPGQTVLDIASAPGSFLQVIANGVGKS
jgi:23S rRNA (uridine2552-2'-O)-methyltransferase